MLTSPAPHRPMRLATIDVGTNTALLLVADSGGADLAPVATAGRFVRLGEGVDAAGRIGAAATERLVDALTAFAAIARAHDAAMASVAATSAMRDAANRDAVCAAVREATGLDVEVIDGATEAVWSYAAARSAFPALTGRAAVLDIGGGSTEVVVGDAVGAAAPAEAIAFRHSFDLGCIRLTERCFTSQPPAPGEADAAARLAADAFAAQAPPLGADVPLVGTAGTLTALALAHAGPDATWDALDADARTLDATTVRRWRRRLLQMTTAEVRALHPAAMTGRADVFPVGVLLTDVLMQQYGLPRVHVSARDLRYGLAFRALRR